MRLFNLDHTHRTIARLFDLAADYLRSYLGRHGTRCPEIDGAAAERPHVPPTHVNSSLDNLLPGVFALVMAGTLPGEAPAQIVQSERGTVSQTIDGTTISIDYGRPRMKGRGTMLDDVVDLGDHRWTPGADWASTLSSNRPFQLNGHRVPAGVWSLWIDLEPDVWTMIRDPTDSIYHTEPPEDHPDQIRFIVEPREGPFIESLLFWVPETRILGFDLLLSWGQTEIPFEVLVEPSFETVVARDQGDPLIGTYTFEWLPEPGYPDPQPVPFDISWSGEHLYVDSELEDTGEEEDGWLIPRGEGFFWFGVVRDGALFDIEVDIVYEVVRDEAGRVVGLDALWADDSLIATVRRR